MNHRSQRIIQLYSEMPGAPAVPDDDLGNPVWGLVENNAHWRFCATIIDLMDVQWNP